ncbi:DNA polymerase III subunit delta' [Neptunitalea chrysea]|uniref:DNA polymerase III subunit delta n=1 Tax=Neptunitalea chrysea TaxID=1647581 RepID=A0A9W6EU18_9FLAO|nr:DNA polymerase III subunit delta' [Neptunitalea chrysea]GLB52910.1 DNA polymerase III subunit delta' [Neptunitalea chrysea]
MLFSEILGQQHIKNHLTVSADSNRVAHAQLFVGPEGCGTLPMAIAYAQYLLCKNVSSENTGGNESCNLKFEHLAHPDLHFAFPVATNDKVKKHAVSNAFMNEWRQFVAKQPYGNTFDWFQLLGIENKQGIIGVDEATDIVKSLSLKSYEGGYKIMLIWMADRMNTAAANKLLKLIEEPPKDTIFLLIAEKEEQIIQTIRSRCQILHFPPLTEEVIKQGLVSRGIPEAEAGKVAHSAQGNYNKAIDLSVNDSEDLVFERWFIFWVRSAFKAKGNKAVINDLIMWSEEIAGTGRETQKQFLTYCMEVFRQALLLHYQTQDLVYMDMHEEGFKLEKFAPFVHSANIIEITKELETAMYHVERNGNAKIIFTDLSIKLTRYLHKKETV